MKKEINLDEFDRFLEGKMDVVERELFTQKVESSERVKEALLLHEIIVNVAKDTPLRESIRTVNVQTKNLIQEKQRALFNKYLNNELSASEKKDFENKLKSKDHQLFSFEFQEFKKSRIKEPKIISMYTRRALQIAAVLLIGVVSYWLFMYLPGKEIDSNNLYAQYYEAPSHDIAMVATKSDKDLDEDQMNLFLEREKLKEDGLNAFGNQQYITANEKLTQYIQGDSVAKDEIDNFLYLYLGLTYKEKGDIDRCIEMLEYASDNITSYPHLRDLIQWHLALTYLKKKQIEKTKNILKNLTLSDHPKTQNDAVNLLKEIK